MNIETKRNNIVHGIRNYCAESGFKKVMLGLSGGMDSALVLALACDAVGADNVYTFMMKTKYTSAVSVNLAKEAADLNGAHHEIIDIQSNVDEALKSLTFTPQNPVTEQNLQSRTRGLLSMAYSNEYGYLLLACGNKSEAAMGYCTLYGDTCGGISPIGDLFKTEVYEMADLYNREGRYFIPKGIIDRPPTAELAFNQKDTDSLLPYPVLDPILRDYVYGQKEVPTDLKQTVATVQHKYKIAEFKRKQMPMSIPADYIYGKQRG